MTGKENWDSGIANRAMQKQMPTNISEQKQHCKEVWTKICCIAWVNSYVVKKKYLSKSISSSDAKPQPAKLILGKREGA